MFLSVPLGDFQILVIKYLITFDNIGASLTYED